MVGMKGFERLLHLGEEPETLGGSEREVLLDERHVQAEVDGGLPRRPGWRRRGGYRPVDPRRHERRLARLPRWSDA